MTTSERIKAIFGDVRPADVLHCESLDEIVEDYELEDASAVTWPMVNRCADGGEPREVDLATESIEDYLPGSVYMRHDGAEVHFNVKLYRAWNWTRSIERVDPIGVDFDDLVDDDWQWVEWETEYQMDYLYETFPALDMSQFGRAGRQSGYLTYQLSEETAIDELEQLIALEPWVKERVEDMCQGLAVRHYETLIRLRCEDTATRLEIEARKALAGACTEGSLATAKAVEQWQWAHDLWNGCGEVESYIEPGDDVYTLKVYGPLGSKLEVTI